MDEIIRSVKNQKWKRLKPESNLLERYKNHSMPIYLAELLASRKIDYQDPDNYLEPKLKTFLKDPNHLLGMKEAIDYLANAITKANKKIAIFGDYDVDGATSCALLKNYFKAIGIEVGIYIPDRLIEGYGPNIAALTYLKEQGFDIIITTDCGAVAYETLDHAKTLGLDVIVIDHHIGGDSLPTAIAVVNPNRQDENSEFKYLAAVGVCFLLIISLNSKLRSIGFFNQITEPNLFEFLDLVALGTICDVVPLVGLNRAFVTQGLKIINNRKNPGIKALANVCGLNSEINTYHLGFVLGPRINAGGRVGKADLGATLLSCNNINQAHNIALELEMHNQTRKAIELNIIEQATTQADQMPKTNPLVFVANDDWHPGIIGIIAGRLKEKFNKPSAVISFYGNNEIGKASCRSISGVDFGSAVCKAKEKNLLIAGGGHKMAAGFSVEKHKLQELHEFFQKEFHNPVKLYQNESLNYYEGVLCVAGLSVELIRYIEKLGPFGAENQSPKFLINNIYIFNPRIVGGEHISFMVKDRDHSNSQALKAIAFKALKSPMSEILLSGNNYNLGLIATLSINEWNGNYSPELIILDCLLQN